VNVVREQALAVELDDGQPLAVLGLERRIAGDVDLDELERIHRPHVLEHLASALAEVTARRDEERDPRRYGYRPRVVVASATRWTARPYAAMRIDMSLS
jgi:hypothetical protein